MEQFIELFRQNQKKKFSYVIFVLISYLNIIFNINMLYSENMQEKQLNFIQRSKLSKIMKFGADADIYMDKK